MDSLIEKLCDDLEPTKCTRHPLACSSGWIIMSLVITAILVWKMGLRDDLSDVLHVPEFSFELILIALIGVSATYCSALLRIPDMRGKKWALVIPLTMCGLFVIWKFIHIVLGYINMPHMHFHHCMGEGLMIAAIPTILMFIMSMQGCTTRPIWMVVMNGLAVASISYIALRLTCSSEDLGHVLYTHLLPFMIVGCVLGFVARRFYKW